MRKLKTIQTKENLNYVRATDEIGPGGANHEYSVYRTGSGMRLSKIQFQKGARKEADSIHGVIDSDLLEIVRDRLKKFQAGPFASEYNEHALKHIEEALHCLNARVEDRIKRNILGINKK